MKGFWNLLCVLMMFAAFVLILASAGTTDYALLEEGVKQPENAKTMLWVAVGLMIPGAATLVYKRIGEWLCTK